MCIIALAMVISGLSCPVLRGHWTLYLCTTFMLANVQDLMWGFSAG